ncbi:MAG: hypothetical protein VYC11_03675, partial [Candidatus Thermoplasmatota archaeon]|nr:hypothetical protein [Candidatus Thermoplasmatota archaeon]
GGIGATGAGGGGISAGGGGIGATGAGGGGISAGGGGIGAAPGGGGGGRPPRGGEICSSSPDMRCTVSPFTKGLVLTFPEDGPH